MAAASDKDPARWPLQEVAGEFGVFPECKSPALVPEAIDEEAALPATEVTTAETAPA